MAKLSIEYGKIKKDGSRSVMIRLVSGRTQKHIPTYVNLEKRDYKEYPDGRIRVTNNAKYFDIEDFLSNLQTKVNEVMRSCYGYTPTAEQIYGRIYRPTRNEVRGRDFIAYGREWLDGSGIKAKHNYSAMLNSLERFMGGKPLLFGDINVELLTKYCRSLDGKKRAQSLYLACIRHIYRQAALQFNTDDDIVLSPYLFDRFKVPEQKIVGQRALSVDEVRTFFATEASTKSERLAKDCAMLSICLCGTNLVDLYNATSYDGHTFAYERTKTKDRRSDGAHIEIAVHEKIRPLFEKYRCSDGNRVFCFARCKSYERFYESVITGLRRLKKRLGWDVLQFYQFRHSWASIARNELGIDKATVDEGLNHVGDNRIADIYIKKDYRHINEANRKVIEYLFGE